MYTLCAYVDTCYTYILLYKSVANVIMIILILCILYRCIGTGEER